MYFLDYRVTLYGHMSRRESEQFNLSVCIGKKFKTLLASRTVVVILKQFFVIKTICRRFISENGLHWM